MSSEWENIGPEGTCVVCGHNLEWYGEADPECPKCQWADIQFDVWKDNN